MSVDVNSLHKTELQYELSVRGKQCDYNVDELRKRVRKVMLKESSGARVYTRYISRFLDDLTGVEST